MAINSRQRKPPKDPGAGNSAAATGAGISAGSNGKSDSIKTRKTGPTHGVVSAQATVPPAVIKELEAPKESVPAPVPQPGVAANIPATPAETDLKASKKAPRKLKKPTSRENIRTIEARLKELPALPSLKTTKSPAMDLQPVDANAAPPPAPPPAVEPDPAASKFIDRGAAIPEHYGMDRLAVLPRDANWLFVYWELKGGALERLRFKHSAEVIDNSRWVLRVRTPSAFGSYLVDVDLRCGQWYLKVSPGTRFGVDLGLMSQQGEFMQVLQGNEASTPNGGVSSKVDENWMVTREELEKLLAASGAGKNGPAALPWGADRGHASQGDQAGGTAASPIVRSEQPRALGLFSGSLGRKNP